MNNRYGNLVIFVVGVTIGAVVSWKFCEKKYRDIAQEEIDSVKEVYNRKEQKRKVETEESEEEVDHAEVDPQTLMQYATMLSGQKYRRIDYSDGKHEDDKQNREEVLEVAEDVDAVGEPYIISPEEFGEEQDYDRVSLTYYNDRVLADINDIRISDIEDTVGLEALESFGEYEDDSVFVRNDRIKIDFEILLDSRNFEDVVKRRPHEVD